MKRLPARVLSYLLVVILSFSLLAPTISLIKAQSVNVPRASHTPQISVDVPGGMKVNTWNGNLFYSVPLLAIPNRGLPIAASLSYNTTWYETDEGFGAGWQMGQNMFYEIEADSDVVIVWQDGRSETYDESSGSYTAPIDIFNTLQEYETDKFRLTTKTNTIYEFSDSSHKKLTKITDENGDSIDLSYSSGKLNSISDGHGRGITFAYTSDKLTTLTNTAVSPNLVVSLAYDSEGRVQKITNPRGNEMSYEYDENNFLTKVTDTRNNAVDITYKEGVASSIIHSEGAKVYFNFDALEKRTSHIEYFQSGQHRVTRYDYDNDGRIGTIDYVVGGDGSTITESFVWDTEDQLTTYTDALGRSTNYTYDNNGNILQIINPLSNSENYTYDSEDRLITATDARGNTTTYTYDSNGNLLTVTDAAGNVTTNTYDTNGDLLTTTDAKNSVTTFAYDQYGNVTSTTDPKSNVTSQTYDNLGRVLTSTDGNSNTATNEYSDFGDLLKVTDALSNEASFVYDSFGQLTTQTDAENSVTTFEYDSVGRQIKVTDAVAATTENVYNEHGQLIQMIDASSGTYSYEYDYLGRLIKEIDPEGNEIRYEHDSVGNVTAKTDANGDSTTYSYDQLNRIVQANYADGSSSTYEYDENGNVVREGNGSVVIIRTYDSLNRQTSVETRVNGISKTISYQYDELGNRKKMIDADGGETVYEYDEVGNLKKITDPDGNVTNYGYDSGYRVTSKNLPNGVVTSYAYDKLNRLTELSNTKNSGNTVLSKYAYTYDKVGNRLTQTLNNTDVTDYGYDAIYQLERVDYPDSSYQEMTYDALGNRLTFDESGSVTSSVYGADNRIESVGGTSYTHDANGNLLNDGVATYTYDSLNRLTSFDDGNVNESYSYYPDGKRLSKTDSSGTTTYYFYDGENVLFETNSNGAVNSSFVSSGIDGWLSMKDGSSRNYYVQDGLNSVIGLYDSSADSINSYSYDAFGNSVTKNETVTNPFEYIGRRNDESNGLYYNRARYYDPKISRFITKDPAGMVDAVNMYLYAGNNSINFVDGSGLFIERIVHFATNLVMNAPAAFVSGKQTEAKYTDSANDENDALRHSEWHKRMVERGIPLSNVLTFGLLREGGSLFTVGIRDFGEYIHQTGMDLHNNLQGMRAGLIGKEVEQMLSDGGLIVNDPKRGAKSFSYREVLSTFGNRISNFFNQADQYRVSDDLDWGAISGSFSTVGTPFQGVSQGVYAEGGFVIGVEGNLAYVIEAPPEVLRGTGGDGSSDELWDVTYYSGTNFEHEIRTVKINSKYLKENWGEGNPPHIGNTDKFSARFRKNVYFSHAGTWQFNIESDDGFRIRVNGNELGNWWDAEHRDTKPFDIPAAGHYLVEIDYYENEGTAYIQVDWKPHYGDGATLFVNGNRNPSLGYLNVDGDVADLSEYDFDNKTKSVEGRAPNTTESDKWQVALFEDPNYEGDFFTVDSNHDDLFGTNVFNGGDSEVSSVKVKRKDLDIVTLAASANLNGEHLHTDRTLNNLDHWRKDNWAQSMRIKNGYEAVVCVDPDFRGECGRIKSPDDNYFTVRDMGVLNPALLTSTGSGTASSVQVCEDECPAAPIGLQFLPATDARFDPGSNVELEWFASGDDYRIEVTGGELASPRYYETDGYRYEIPDLPASENPYSWRVRGWNDYGHGDWSASNTFYVKDIEIQEVAISSADAVKLHEDLTVTAAVTPDTAGNLAYQWSPEPTSGQGTDTATFNFAALGDQQISVDVSNTGSSAGDSKTVRVGCAESEYEAYYFLNMSLQGDSVGSECVSTIDKDWGTEGPAGIDNRFGTGADGDLEVNSGETVVINEIITTLTQDVSAGADVLTVTSTTDIEVGDEVLIIQSQYGNTGVYDRSYVEAKSDTTLTLEQAVQNSYVTSGTQVVRIPQYQNVTVAGTLEPPDWDGTVGGILIFRARGVVELADTNAVIGKRGTGYRGGERTYGGWVTGQQGEGVTGVGTRLTEANQNGGGGGRGTPSGAAAGGGGSHYGSGQTGWGDQFALVDRGKGGNLTLGSDLQEKIFFGGGGGAGGTDDSGSSGTTYGGKGGDGGGIIMITASTITGQGYIYATGEDGEAYDPNNTEHGGGGGGATGTINLEANYILNENLNISQGGAVGGISARGGQGGSSAGGRVKLVYCEELESTINFAHHAALADCDSEPAEANFFSARFSRSYDFSEGDYRFITKGDDGIRVYIDGEKIIDRWANGAYDEEGYTHQVSAGTKEIVVEYYDRTGPALINFEIEAENQSPQLSSIPEQAVKLGEEFATLDLGAYVTEPEGEAVTWSVSAGGNVTANIVTDSELQVSSNKVDWIGSEQLTVIATDSSGNSSSTTVTYTKNYCDPGEFEARYYNNKNVANTPKLARCESNIDYDWEEQRPAPGVRANNFSAKWENMFEFEEGGYMFETVSDDGVRLFVDNQLVIDNWSEHEATKDVVELEMTAGQHAVRMEYYDAGGSARAELEWWQPEGGEPQEPGDYEIASHFVAGDSGSVTNTEINPGEEISLGMSIQNNTDAEIAKWIVNLSSDNEYVTILDGREVATNIPAGESSRINGNFQFEVSEKAPINEVLSFTVSIRDQSTGQTETYKAHQIVRDPKELPESTTELVSYQDYKVLKGGEIGMSKPAYAGEEVEFKLSIHSWLETSEMRVYIFSDSEYANIIDNYEKATNFTEDTTKLTGRFDVEIDANTPDGENILFEGFALIKNDDSGGYESVASFEFEIPVNN